jgi:hypothetical protein
MSYTKTTFVDGGPPGISAAELNKIGQGIADAHSAIDGHVEDLASASQMGHFILGDPYYTRLELTPEGILRLQDKPPIRYGNAEYTDSFSTVFNVPKEIFIPFDFLPETLLTVHIANRSDLQKFLTYQVFPRKGYTVGVVRGRNSNNDVLELPYPLGGDSIGLTSSATTIGYGVAGTARQAIQMLGINTSSGTPKLELHFSGVEAIAQSLNCRVEFFLSC